MTNLLFSLHFKGVEFGGAKSFFSSGRILRYRWLFFFLFWFFSHCHCTDVHDLIFLWQLDYLERLGFADDVHFYFGTKW